MTSTLERIPTIVLGREIGTHTESDVETDTMITFYEFLPNTDASLSGIPAGALTANFETGLFETYDDDGNIDWSLDIVVALSSITRTLP